ncbi:MAG TPA: Lpp/OprI family alanine-zipper lipoprotein [Woeseiaceae bacterium]
MALRDLVPVPERFERICRGCTTAREFIAQIIEGAINLRNNAPAFFSTRGTGMMMSNIIKVSALALVLGAAAGCANTAERDQLQATVDQAARDAAAAKSAAEAARAAADSAAQAARNAQATADEALAAAEEAQSCCDANRDRLERMFQKSMSK